MFYDSRTRYLFASSSLHHWCISRARFVKEALLVLREAYCAVERAAFAPLRSKPPRFAEPPLAQAFAAQRVARRRASRLPHCRERIAAHCDADVSNTSVARRSERARGGSNTNVGAFADVSGDTRVAILTDATALDAARCAEFGALFREHRRGHALAGRREAVGAARGRQPRHAARGEAAVFAARRALEARSCQCGHREL